MSFVGCLTLAKSVMEDILVYPMMMNSIPKSCIDELHKVQKIFIWGDSDDNRKYHAMKWDTVTKMKKEGGLGLIKMDAMKKSVWNEACLESSQR